MTEVTLLTDMLLCEVLRGQREIDRLLLEMALEPELTAAIARCPRPYIDNKPLREQGTTTFPVLTILCPDRKTADVLYAAPWGWYYLPFQGGCFGLCLQFPGGAYTFTPDDPRVLAFEAALPHLVSDTSVANLVVEYESVPWTIRGASGWKNAEPDELDHCPAICLVCSCPETLNRCRSSFPLLQRLAVALIPNLKQFTLLYWPDQGKLEAARIALNWAQQDYQC